MTICQLVLLSLLEIYWIVLVFLQVVSLLLIYSCFLDLDQLQIVRMIVIQQIEQALAYKTCHIFHSIPLSIEPTRVTDNPTSIAGRIPDRNKSADKAI